jgi:hypothetical protein
MKWTNIHDLPSGDGCQSREYTIFERSLEVYIYGGCTTVEVEQLYQAFKERLIAEMDIPSPKERG